MSEHHIHWSHEFELGIEDIDIQHHFFVNLINRLIDELARPDVTAYRAALISELNAYARFHFISEENLMARAGYPHLDEHRDHHFQLIEQLSAKQNRLMLNDSAEEAEAIIRFLMEWFVNHTTREDRRFVDFTANAGH